jgi:hypothetical protein
VPHPGVSVLQHQAQVALAEIQALERERLDPVNPAPSWGTTPIAGPAVVAGFGGKPAPMQPQQPEI